MSVIPRFDLDEYVDELYGLPGQFHEMLGQKPKIKAAGRPLSNFNFGVGALEGVKRETPRDSDPFSIHHTAIDDTVPF